MSHSVSKVLVGVAGGVVIVSVYTWHTGWLGWVLQKGRLDRPD